MLAEGWARKTETRVRTGSLDVEITLSRGGSIRGTITLEGKPMPGARVTNRLQKWAIPVETLSGADGTYMLGPLPDGRHSVSVRTATHAAPPRHNLELGEGETMEGVDFDLKPLGSISGRVESAEDKLPLPNVWVGVTAENNERWLERRDSFFGVPAVVHFVSVEPMLEAIFFSDDDLAGIDWIICGGDLSGPEWVDEQYILDLEREAFVDLMQHPKSIERVMHMLSTGKPLRN